MKRAQLRDAKRTETRLTADLARAETAAATIDVELNALLAEARAVGLVENPQFSGRTELVRLLQGARVAQPLVAPLPDREAQDRRLALQAERDRLRGELRGVLAERGLLLHETRAETGAAVALRQQRDRLAVLARLPGPASATEPDGDAPLDADTCPACRPTGRR